MSEVSVAHRTNARSRGRGRASEALESRLLMSTYTVSSLDDSGPGSLREAIAQANASHGGTITFAVTGEIDLTSGELELTAPVTIDGPGADRLAISGSSLSRILHVDSGVTATVSGLTFTHGRSAPGTDGGAIWNAGNLNLSHDVFRGNAAGDADNTPGEAGGNGGAVSNERIGGAEPGTLDASFDVFENNTAGRGATAGARSGWGGSGGAIYNDTTLTVSESTFRGNRAGTGGAGYYGGFGGGVYNQGLGGLGNCTFVNNSAGDGGSGPTAALQGTGGGGDGGSGGGVWNLEIRFGAGGCTFFANKGGDGGAGGDSATTGVSAGQGGRGGSGGGMFTAGTVASCTISGNHPGAGGRGGLGPTGPAPSGADGGGSGVYFNGGPGPRIYNNIIAGNPNAGNDPFGDVAGWIDLGSDYNLIGNNASFTWVGGQFGVGSHNQIGTAAQPIDPKLGPLGEYGGPTQTMPLLARSPALDAGGTLFDPSGAIDQRGFPRQFGRAVDIGAFEAQPPLVSGDVNHDGVTNFADLLLLVQHYGATTVPLYESGDLTGDGTVGFDDLLNLAQNYGQTPPPLATMSAAAGVQPGPIDLVPRKRKARAVAAARSATSIF